MSNAKATANGGNQAIALRGHENNLVINPKITDYFGEKCYDSEILIRYFFLQPSSENQEPLHLHTVGWFESSGYRLMLLMTDVF